MAIYSIKIHINLQFNEESGTTSIEIIRKKRYRKTNEYYSICLGLNKSTQKPIYYEINAIARKK